MLHPTQVNSHQQLRHPADLRSLFWAFGLFPLPACVAIAAPSFTFAAALPALYFGFCAGVLSHYHTHRPVFRSRWLNHAYAAWLSIFYGFPLVAWIPTHNQNHHQHINSEQDNTCTKKMGSDSLLCALSYPLCSSRWQLPTLARYLRTRTSRHKASVACAQSLVLLAVHAGLISACTATNRTGGLLAYVLLVWLPAAFASWSMMFINYLQHVGCDPLSADNHSRNFVGRAQNWLAFNAGFHTVHHEAPTAHWSDYRRMHAERKGSIDPRLNEQDILSFVVHRYLLGRDTTVGE